MTSWFVRLDLKMQQPAGPKQAKTGHNATLLHTEAERTVQQSNANTVHISSSPSLLYCQGILQLLETWSELNANQHTWSLPPRSCNCTGYTSCQPYQSSC